MENVSIQEVLLFVLLPMASIVAGGVLTTFFKPGPLVRSGLQHLAAGVIFYAVAVELLPEVISHKQAAWAIVIGFSVGVIFLLTVEWFTSRAEHKKEGRQLKEDFNPTGLLVAVGLDVTLDGLLIGLSFAAGAKEGIILVIALTIEDLFLGLSTALTLTKGGFSHLKVVGINIGLAMLTGLGGVFGATIFGGLQDPWLEGVLSFGVAALLYLVTEELLVEAHSGPDTPFATSMFFAGFLLFLMIGILT